MSARLAKTHTLRARVLAVIEAADAPMTGHQVADAAGITYRQAIFALNALNNAAHVGRIGRKFTARWVKVQAMAPDVDLLHRIFWPRM